jgi:hypothetical protein
MHWFAKDMVPGRHVLGWFSLCIVLAAFTTSTVGLFLGWPSWRIWALFGLGEAAAASWYARGRMDGLVALAGGLGVLVLLVCLVFPR